jgi:hypothetical protein
MSMMFDPKWFPPRSKLGLYARGEKLVPYVEQGRVDLSDTVLTKAWPHRQRTVEMRLSTRSTRWKVWDEEAVSNVEAYIRYDFGFESYYVIIKRLSGMGEPCTTEMCWKLTVRAKF